MKSRRRKNNNFGMLLVGFSFICVMICACGLVVSLFSSSGGLLVPTPKVFDTPLPIPTIIALTYSAAGTQTAIANPMPLATSTLAPVLENEPTATIFIFELQTNVARPTDYIYSTNTPFSLATESLRPTQAVLATQPVQSGVCSCSGDTLNCSDFGTHSAAQQCYNYCISQGAGDIHGLDSNSDGSACESLP